MPDRAPALQFVLKVASRCNLNCSYCYVYNKGDESWRGRPPFMSAETRDLALARIRRHCLASGQDEVRITFHGGEPCLLGPLRFDEFCDATYRALSDVCVVRLSLQTNGTLIDERWAEVLSRHRVSVGISLDGPEDVHDALRVNLRGHGTYADVVRGLACLRAASVERHILCVIHFDANGRRVHRHLLGLGVRRINYLLPDFTHDSVQPVFARYGPTPCADYLLPVLDDWWAAGTLEPMVSPFDDMTRLILGGETYIDLFGNRPYQYCFVETDGAIEGLDVLRICGRGLPATALHVGRDDFTAIADRSALHRTIIFEGPSLPTSCRACPERDTCGGGYLPHRHSAAREFDNSSVWCRDLLRLFGRLREHLGVSPDDTRRRRIEALRTPQTARTDRPSSGAGVRLWREAYPHHAARVAQTGGGVPMDDRVPSLTEVSAVLTWLDDHGVAAALHESWSERAAAALDQLLVDASARSPVAVGRCRGHLAALDDEGRSRALLAPETTFRTVSRRAPLEDSVAFIERALVVERARRGDAVTSAGCPAWSALGDVAVGEHGRFLAAPAVAGLPPLDFDSPYGCRLDLSGREYTIARPRPPLEGERRDRVLRRLSTLADGLEATAAAVASCALTFTKVLILQGDDTPEFSSGSNGEYVGRSFIQNPQFDHVDECDLADALVHESIHGLLYMHESARPWVTWIDLYDPAPRLVSPWSGTILPVRPFLQACFVWYGLANFWAHAMSRGSFPRARCKTLLARAAAGFLSEPLTARFDAFREGLTDEVVSAITAMQGDVRSVFATVA